MFSCSRSQTSKNVASAYTFTAIAHLLLYNSDLERQVAIARPHQQEASEGLNK